MKNLNWICIHNYFISAWFKKVQIFTPFLYNLLITIQILFDISIFYRFGILHSGFDKVMLNEFLNGICGFMNLFTVDVCK